MFNYDRFAKVATAAVGALVLSTLSITAAVGPAQAARPQAGRLDRPTAAAFKAPANG